jgi:hypothetical protein
MDALRADGATAIRALFAGLMAVMWLTRVRRIVALVVASTVLIAVVTPQPVFAQIEAGPILAAVASVLNTINNVIRGLFSVANNVLSQINAGMQAFRNLMNIVVYPQALIASARGMVSSMIATFRGLLSSIFNINVASAQLPAPSALEGVIRNRSVGDFGALSQTYVQTYGQLPPAANASPMERDLIDADDAAAQALLKTLKAADAVSDQTIAASMLLEDEGQQVAPGTADYLVAAGIIASVENQAVMQKMIAAQMRQEAARLAHQNMIRKRNAMFGNQLRNSLSDFMQRR